MNETHLVNELKELSKALAARLDKANKNENLLRESLREIFPYELYKNIRPDVAQMEWASDEDAVISHYLKFGINELDLKAEIKKFDSFKIGEENALRIARDILLQRKIEDRDKENGKSLTLSKVLGNNKKIAHNQNHEIARQNTILHLKSNSICTWIPKNACSTLRYSIAKDNGVIESIAELPWIHNNNESFTASNKELLTADYSFTVLRNPFRRILSFFLDKICSCSDTELDTSSAYSRKNFGTNEETSFEDFVNTLYKFPFLIDQDMHTRRQCDFLIYRKYDDYFSLENFNQATKKVKEKIGLKLFDTREYNNIYTTKGAQTTKSINKDTKAKQIAIHLREKKMPDCQNMYSPDITKKICSIYLADIILYCEVIPEGLSELKPWLEAAIKV